MLGYVCWVGLFGGYVVMEWGPEIKVDGVQPKWLSGDTVMQWKKPGSADWGGSCRAMDHNWGPYIHTSNTETTFIRLHGDHFAYTAIAKGFTPWGGGSEAPMDWDGFAVLTRNGDLVDPYGGGDPRHSRLWNNDGLSVDIIGYHPKPIAQPSPADTVTIARMTEAQWRDKLGARNWERTVQGLTELSLIRPATKAERIAKSTNLPLADVELVLAAYEQA